MWAQLNKRALLAGFLGLMLAYGLLAMDISRVLFETLLDGGHRQEMVAEFDQRGEAGAGAFDRWQRARDGSLWMALFSAVTERDFGYGFESAYEVMVGYFRLPRLNHALLAVHTGTGGMALMLMTFLLIPAFRRRSFRFHRHIGRTAAALLALSMVCSIGYLSTTPEELVFADIAFYVGLWILAIITSVSLAVSIISIRRGNRARHQAFMHLAFAAMLTAPLLRLDWMIIWAFNPDSTFVQNHYLAEIILLPQCLVAGYLFFAWARSRNPLLAPPPQAPAVTAVAGHWRPLVGIVAGAFAAYALAYLDLEWRSYAGASALGAGGQFAAAVQANGMQLLNAQPALFAAQKLLMVGAALLAITLVAWQLLTGTATQALPERVPRLLAMTVLGAGLLALWAGIGLGAPSHAVRSAGGYLVVYGLLAIVLAIGHLYGRRTGAAEFVRDSYWLLIGLAVTPAQFSQSWFTMSMTGLSALDVYALSAGNAVLGLVPALAWVMWTQHPARRRVY